MKIYDLTNLYPYRPLQKHWYWVIPAISAVASVVGNLLTNKSNKDINQQQIDNQHEILKKEQDYNTYMMENQKQMQMNDAKQAGINPAYAGSSSLLGASSGSPSAPSVSQIPMQNPIGDAISSALNFMLQQQQTKANVENLEADTYKKMAETDRQKIENQYLPSMLKGQIAIMEKELDVYGSQIKLNEAECKQVAATTMAKKAEVNQINAKTEEIKASMQNINADTRLKEIEKMWKSEHMQAIIQNLKSASHLSYEEARDLVATRVLRIANLQGDLEKKAAEFFNISADTANKQAMQGILNIQEDHMSFNLNSDKWFKNAERIVGLINGSVNVLKQINDMISTWVPLGKLGKVADVVSKAPQKTSPTPMPTSQNFLP